MTTSSRARADRPLWAAPGRAVVVGVDGSSRNAAAIEYAAELAHRTGRPLRLTSVVDSSAEAAVMRLVTPGATAWGTSPSVLQASRARAARAHPGLAISEQVREGSPVSGLLQAAADEAVLVVGRRGLGALARSVIGSTSIGVAGRAVVPVVIVPDGWPGALRPEAPVVVALHAGEHEDTLLDHAFGEASAVGAPLVVVRVQEPEPAPTYDAWFGPSPTGAEPLDQPVEPQLAPYRAAHPKVEVTVVGPTDRQSKLLLHESEDARLIVLGRGHRAPWGLGLGSLARTVLHKAQVPVAVVPTGVAGPAPRR